MDISIVKYKYRGKTLSLTSYPDNELTLLFENHVELYKVQFACASCIIHS